MIRPAASDSSFLQIALEQLSALYGFAMTLTHEQTAAEDLVQETYLRALRSFDKLAPDSNHKSWLFTIMRNVWLNEVRHAHSGPRFVDLDSDESDAREIADNNRSSPHVVFMRKITREEVRSAIESLPLQYREVVVLRDLEGFSYQEIASILNCPAGTVMSRLGRARQRLRLLLSRWQGESRNRVKAKEL
jgi:RNA polymerase sigma-70 factor (ECF subfamily)